MTEKLKFAYNVRKARGNAHSLEPRQNPIRPPVSYRSFETGPLGLVA
jgi:hypothetical protein